MAKYVADVPLNMIYRWGGQAVELARGDRYDRSPIPAGEVFDVPDEMADAFESDMGPRPGVASQASLARIPGLRRVPASEGRGRVD